MTDATNPVSYPQRWHGRDLAQTACACRVADIVQRRGQQCPDGPDGRPTARDRNRPRDFASALRPTSDRERQARSSHAPLCQQRLWRICDDVIAIATMDLRSPQLHACCRVGGERRGSEGRHDCDPPERGMSGVDNKSLAPPTLDAISKHLRGERPA